MNKKKFYKIMREEIKSFQRCSDDIDRRKRNSELEFQNFAKSCKVKIKSRQQKTK